jgi:hypothetical protein
MERPAANRRDLQPGAGHALDNAQCTLLRGIAKRYRHAARAGTPKIISHADRR